MATTAYRWKPGSRVKINAKVAGQELERIRTRHNGRLTAKDVLEEAKSKLSPLHRAFEWDDGHAARRYRLQQAAYLIRSIEIVVVQSKVKRSSARAFVSVTREKDRSYTSIGHALGDADLRKQVLGQALKELEDWRRRYEKLQEFARVFAAIDRVLPKLRKAT